jgi:ABC-type glycerol-3-phosphate transport system permease component
VLPYVLFALFAIRFMLVTSLKSNAELYVINTVRSGSRAGSPPTISLRSTDAPFWSWFANGLIVSLASKEAVPAIRSRASE